MYSRITPPYSCLSVDCNVLSPKITHLDTQTLYVIQAIDEALYIPTMSELICHVVHFELRAIGVVVGRVPVDISVEKDCIERKAPV